MRLTLRTLLAYLDNTLEPQDAEILRVKLAESGFATQLVTRIRASLVNPDLSSPSPDAVSPVEEANVICEYLDSTLSPEQVAEIERACLESDTHLAEAAACHQILTMVLGQPAEVSPPLRRRVYELPDRELNDIPASGSFSALEIPADAGTQLDADLSVTQIPDLNRDEIETLDQSATQGGKMVHPSEPVTPVGLADSGVSDAPTRLREANRIAGSPPVTTGDRAAGSIQRSDMYGGSIRPSRITPWLVSLALAGVLLFALAQIFSPLLRSRTASSKEKAMGSEEVLVSPEDAPPIIELESPRSNAESLASGETIETLPAPDAATMESVENVIPEPTFDVDKSANLDADVEIDDMPRPMPDDPGIEIGTANDPVMKPLESIDTATESSVAAVSPEAEPLAKSPNEADVEMADTETPAATDVDTASNGSSATILSEKTLLVGRVGDGDWVRLNRGAKIGAGVSMACAPMFQAHLTSDAGADVILVGATNLSWQNGVDDLSAIMTIDSGRVLVGSLEEDVVIGLRMGDDIVKLELSKPEAVVAITRSHFRAPGFDPQKPENHLPTVTILAVQGEAKLTLNESTTTISTGEAWNRRGKREAEIDQIETAPAWIENPDAEQEEVYTLARDTLLELVAVDQPIVNSLREATTFRRSEVAALAGRALLTLGIADVYFGGDGLLSQSDQRNYWPDHYQALVETIDRSSESASDLLASIREMESADAETLYRLLVGYSQKQLAEGDDEILVGLLDSNSMAVRVLAIENLRAITGITLNFRAEQENAVRRAPEIKKWNVRLRKGDIRWQPAS